jgi:hypothetical protein
MVYRSSCILLVEFRNRHACPSIMDNELIETVDSMIEAGYRYKNIEKALGPGSALLLGKEIVESM